MPNNHPALFPSQTPGCCQAQPYVAAVRLAPSLKCRDELSTRLKSGIK
jgi:hypothetical protein